ncbi:hypothetical protein MJL22_28100, partial [Salmonella enterica subsp. enterica serovar Montevideo]|nr:hypothetical protein [Salmonella enterica subsp. enterica serovar Montevideo]
MDKKSARIRRATRARRKLKELAALDSLNPRKGFISASGVHEHFGVSWFNPADLAAKRKAMERGL